MVNVILMLVSLLRFSASHLPEKMHCNVAFSPILALGLFFQIALDVTVSLLSTKGKTKLKYMFETKKYLRTIMPTKIDEVEIST